MIPNDLLTGRRVFVAGGTGNVGRVLVDTLLRAGARVAVASRSPKRMDALRAFASGGNGRLVALAGDIADEHDGPRVRDEALQRLGSLDAAIATLGGFVVAPSILDVPTADLRRALEGYVVAHHRVARNLLPPLRERGGSYTFINGFLAFNPVFPGAGLIAAATAAQAMLTRVIMQELESAPVRVNEVVLYTSFGRPDDDERNRGGVGKTEVGEFVAQLVSARGAGVRGQSIHLKSPEVAHALLAGSAAAR